MTLPKVVVIGGPTASGKSALALHLATASDDGVVGEIIGADSRQLYRGLPIASAGPTADDEARARHHLYGTFDPATEVLSAGAFVARAEAVIADVVARGRRAIVVGGTGLYLRALRVGLDDDAPADDAVRAALVRELNELGLAPLVARLRAGPHDVSHVDTANPVRVLRALEIQALGGVPRDVRALLERPPRPIVDGAAFWLVDPGGQLDDAIARRTRAMFRAGITDEAVALAARLPAGHALLDTIGVKEALDVVRGHHNVDAAIDLVATRTRQYAKRQRTWFKKEPWWTSAPQRSPPSTSPQ